MMTRIDSVALTCCQIRLKTIMLKSSLCDYCDAYILVCGRIIITGEGAKNAAKEEDEKR